MNRVLVLARATTALRLARAIRSQGASPVALVPPQDRDARWLSAMDAVEPAARPSEAATILEAASRLGARAIHPGVSTLAESADLARAVTQAGLRWIGPNPACLEALSNKLALTRLATTVGIPTPRTLGPVTSAEELADAVAALGGPAVAKSVHGGGGRGVVPLQGRSPDDAAQAAWPTLAGLGALMVQEDITHARHVEVQVLADGTGQVITAGTRECSVQRRSQKILEEAPAPFLSREVTRTLEEWSRTLLGHLRYQGLGTCEFLVTPERMVLLEVNARLQVEHAVTEEVTGVDLVRAQLRLADGVRLPDAVVPLEPAASDASQARRHPLRPQRAVPSAASGAGAPRTTAGTTDATGAVPGRTSGGQWGAAAGSEADDRALPVRGHAVEARVYAEDPTTLLPATGTLTLASIPVSLPPERLGPSPLHLRTERGLGTGDAVTGAYNEPLALLTCTAPKRSEALAGLDQALTEVDVRGVPTLTPLLREALTHPDLAASTCQGGGSCAQPGPAYRVTTRWVEQVLRPGALGASALPSSPAQEAADGPSAPDLLRPPTSSEGAQARVAVRAPMNGMLIEVSDAGRVSRGETVAVLEAMKMRLPLPAPADGTLDRPGSSPAAACPAGVASARSVQAGEVIAWITPSSSAAVTTPAASPTTPASPGQPASPTQPASPGQAGTVAESAAASRAARTCRPTRPTAAQRLAELADPGSAIDVVDDDAVLTATVHLGGQRALVWIQDPTRQGGTIGLAGARRVAALIEQAAAACTPVIGVLDGGGARVQEGTDALAGVGLILAALTAARGRTLSIGVVAGPAAGGAAYAPALCDLLVMVDGAGELFLTGPAILASSTGEHVTAEALGGAQVHAASAGTCHLRAPDEAAAWRALRTLVGYAPRALARALPHDAGSPLATAEAPVPSSLTRPVADAAPSAGLIPAQAAPAGPVPADPIPASPPVLLPFLPGGAGRVPTITDQAAGAVVPADPRAPYDVRALVRALSDRSELTELRPQWAPHAVTGLARIGGVPVGVVATQPEHLAGSLDPLAADKIAEHVRLCARLRLPLLTVVDTPGFLPGTRTERAGAVRRGAQVVAAYASYRQAVGYDGALLTLITRRAFGGAYVALASTALAGARTIAWPDAVIGVMDARAAAELTGRRRLARIAAQGGDVEAERARLIDAQRAAQTASTAATQGWIEEVLTPQDTRAWLTRALEDLTRPDTSGPRLAPLATIRHPGDGWVECRCGSRHWGRRGAAGLLVWRYAPPIPAASHPASAASRPPIQVLLQQRAAWTHHGGTWGLPGGALAVGESPLTGALRECEEETGLPARELRPGASHVQDHGDWSYTTQVAQAPSDRAWDRLVSWDGESTSLTWVTLASRDGVWLAPEPPVLARPADGEARLLPALAAVWDELAQLLPPTGPG